MPYPMVHMEIAYKLLEKYDWIGEPGDFVLGSVAPDSVHFHQEYNVHLKEISHLWNCGPRWGVTNESDRWKDNICQFWKLNRMNEHRDFIVGYCAHILTDWLYDRRIWVPFKNKVLQGTNYEEMYNNEQYRAEAYGFDQWMYQTSQNVTEIWELLAKGQVYELDGYIWKEDLAGQKQSILTEQFTPKRKYDISKYVYCAQEAMTAFMTECVDMTADTLNI